MKLFVLKKDIDHPRFACVLKAGKWMPESKLKFYGIDKGSPRFNDFFEESQTHKIENCRIVSINSNGTE